VNVSNVFSFSETSSTSKTVNPWNTNQQGVYSYSPDIVTMEKMLIRNYEHSSYGDDDVFIIAPLRWMYFQMKAQPFNNKGKLLCPNCKKAVGRYDFSIECISGKGNGFAGCWIYCGKTRK